MSDETTNAENGKKPDYEPPAGAETTGSWGKGRKALQYSATGKWTVLRKKEKPAAEIFSIAYVASDGDDGRPVTFVFNGGPGAASAYLHMGAVGPAARRLPARRDPADDAAAPRRERVVVARVLRSRVRRPGRHGLQPRHRAGQEGGRQGRRKAGRERGRSEGVLRLQARPRVAVRVHEPLALGARPLGLARSSSPARATAATASAGSRASYRRRRASGSTARSSSRRRSRSPASPRPTTTSWLARPRSDDGGRRAPSRALARVPQGHVARQGACASPRSSRPATTRSSSRGARRCPPRERDADPLAARRPPRPARGRRRPRRGPRRDPHVRARAPARRAEGARPLRHDDHGDRPVPGPRRVLVAGSDALGDQPGVHDGGQPHAPLGDRRRDRPRVHAALATRSTSRGRTTPSTTRSRRRPARPTTSATAWRSTRT